MLLDLDLEAMSHFCVSFMIVFFFFLTISSTDI